MDYGHPHYLAGNDSTAKPTAHLFVDCETSFHDLGEGKTEHRLKMGWCCYWRRRPDRPPDTEQYEFFTTVNGFWDICEEHTKSREPLHVIMHNVSYDLGVLQGFEQLEKRGWTLRSFYSKGAVSIIRWVQGQKSIKVLDNMNYFKAPLADLGQAVGFPKGKVDFESAGWSELQEYCRRDVEIMVKAWHDLYAFIDMHDLGKWGHTLPSQAFHSYRHRFMPDRLLVHGRPEVTELERAAYHGGRTSVFKRGDQWPGTVYKLDVNSMYPYAMVSSYMPTRLIDLIDNVPLRQVQSMLRKYCLIAEVDVDTPEPVFPVKAQMGNIYPVGEYTTVLTTEELRHALDAGWVQRCHRLAFYHRGHIFQEYVDFFYSLKDQYRQEGNAIYYQMAKLYLNGLYGKFGQKRTEWKQVTEVDPTLDGSDMIIDTRTGKITHLHRFGSQLWSEEDAGEANNAIPSIAAHVTAYARLYLWSLCRRAGAGHYFYTDTDSLLVDCTGLANLRPLLDNSKLGYLKVEGEDTAPVILAPKEYRFEGEWKRKGVPKRAQQIGPDSYEFTRFPSILGQSHWQPGTPFHVQQASRTLTHKITDGMVDDAGFVQPLRWEDVDMSERRKRELWLEIYELEEQLRALKRRRMVPGKMVFRVWNYRRSTFKQRMIADEHSLDHYSSLFAEIATQAGYTDVHEFAKALQEQIELDGKMRGLRQRLASTRALLTAE